MKKDFSTYLDEKSRKKFQSFLKENRGENLSTIILPERGQRRNRKKGLFLGE